LRLNSKTHCQQAPYYHHSHSRGFLPVGWHPTGKNIIRLKVMIKAVKKEVEISKNLFVKKTLKDLPIWKAVAYFAFQSAFNT